eukprot:4330535-Ditylum_brightwellii.AAC.1
MHNKNDSLYFNLKFFDGIPEYHWEVNGLRVDHFVYKEGRILNAQQLLKAYKEAHKKSSESNVSTTAVPSSLTE